MTYSVNITAKLFSTKDRLSSHMRYHNPDFPKYVTCEVCGKNIAKSSLNFHRKTHESKRQTYPCDTCDKVYYTKTGLISHTRLHKGEIIKCVQCPKTFIHQSEYKVHLRFHTNDFRYICDICDKKFATQGHLNAHMNKHLGWKLKCKDCGKLFGARKAYIEHSFKHSVMPYPCLHCSKGYPGRSKLKYHLKTTHSLDVPLDELSKWCILEPNKKMRTKLEWIKVGSDSN